MPGKGRDLQGGSKVEHPTVLVSNRRISHPAPHLISSVVVREGFDSADDYIAVQASVHDIVITADIPLPPAPSKRSPRDKPERQDIHEGEHRRCSRLPRTDVVAPRTGNDHGRPAPIKPKDRSLFLHVLQETIQEIKERTDSDTEFYMKSIGKITNLKGH